MTSIYSPKYVNRHLDALKQFQSGNIIFTFPASPVKCPGAPQKICYITEHFLRKANKRKNAHIYYNSALPTIFGCKYFADALWKVANERDVKVNLKTNLLEVQGNKNIAIFGNVENPDERFSIEVILILTMLGSVSTIHSIYKNNRLMITKYKWRVYFFDIIRTFSIPYCTLFLRKVLHRF